MKLTSALRHASSHAPAGACSRRNGSAAMLASAHRLTSRPPCLLSTPCPAAAAPRATSTRRCCACTTPRCAAPTRRLTTTWPRGRGERGGDGFSLELAPSAPACMRTACQARRLPGAAACPGAVQARPQPAPRPSCLLPRAVKKVQPVLGGFDPGAYTTERLWAAAPDGTRVPISLVYRTDLAKVCGAARSS